MGSGRNQKDGRQPCGGNKRKNGLIQLIQKVYQGISFLFDRLPLVTQPNLRPVHYDVNEM